MKLLFVHSNYPAQFRHLIHHFIQSDENQVVFLSQHREWTAPSDEGLELVRYQLGRDAQGQLCHPYLRRFESAVLQGQAAVRQAIRLKEKGFIPDLIIGHSGFGNTLFLKEVWPKAKFLGYYEWFYRSQGSDVGFGKPMETPSPDTACRVHTYNAPIVMDLALSDGGLCPTKWQASQFPPSMRQQLDVIFDGIDTTIFTPKPPSETLEIRDLKIDSSLPLVTYVTRGFEPYRGWPQVVKGLALLLQRNPRAHVLLVGSDDVAYGSKRGDGKTWREWGLEKYPMDPSRLHMLPALQYEEYREVLRHSWVHVYWTIPFILSWSLVESLASGCSVVASQTAPVEEIITHGNQGVLVDFFDPDGLANQVDALLKDSIQRKEFGNRARHHILEKGYDLETCLKQQLQLVERVLG